MAGAALMAQPRKDFARALERLGRAVALAPPGERADLVRMRDEVRQRARQLAADAVAAGRAALERTGGHEEALDRFLEAASILPDYAAAHAEAARVYRYKGDFRGALDALDRARAALDATGAAADDPLRRDVEALRRRYEKERDEE
jgi:tetratricopeptide (TPR) repeat protein